MSIYLKQSFYFIKKYAHRKKIPKGVLLLAPMDSLGTRYCRWFMIFHCKFCEREHNFITNYAKNIFMGKIGSFPIVFCCNSCYSIVHSPSTKIFENRNKLFVFLKKYQLLEVSGKYMRNFKKEYLRKCR